MSKFNHMWFGFIVSLTIIGATPVDLGKFGYDFLEDTDNDYDLHYDQRQNGTENYRIHFDGFVIAIPGISEPADNHYSNLMQMLGLLVSSGKAESNNGNSEGDKTIYNYEKSIDLAKDSSSASNTNTEDENQHILNKKKLAENPMLNNTNDNTYLNMQEKNADKRGRAPFHLINLLKFIPRRDRL